MAEETIFSKIIRKEIPADIVYQDDLVTAFRDINPRAPTHILIIPNNVIPTVDDVTSEDEQVLGRLFTAASKIARAEGIADDGYRLIVNCRQHGGQEVYHLHMHLLGGRPLGRMDLSDVRFNRPAQAVEQMRPTVIRLSAARQLWYLPPRPLRRTQPVLRNIARHQLQFTECLVTDAFTHIVEIR